MFVVNNSENEQKMFVFFPYTLRRHDADVKLLLLDGHK